MCGAPLEYPAGIRPSLVVCRPRHDPPPSAWPSAHCAPRPCAQVAARSSSRVGDSDFGVNAKRVNYIAKGLREKGWTAAGVAAK